jgi:hypothetical protein
MRLFFAAVVVLSEADRSPSEWRQAAGAGEVE